MSWFALGLIGFAVTDLVRWSPEQGSRPRSVIAVLVGVAATAGLAGLCGIETSEVLVVAAVATVALIGWATLSEELPVLRLAWIATALAVVFAVSGSADPVEGDLAEWYAGLDFTFVETITVEQFVLGVAAGLFLLATSNRIVRLVLEATGTSPQKGETALRGGRILGPMERIIVAAIVLAGDPAGAALVIAAKGLLRFPEIRAESGQPDQVTEYFLIGTFTSLLLAAALAVVVLAAG